MGLNNVARRRAALRRARGGALPRFGPAAGLHEIVGETSFCVEDAVVEAWARRRRGIGDARYQL